MEPANANDSANHGRDVLVGRLASPPALASACAVFLACLALAGVALAALQFSQHGIAGVQAAVIALAACGLSSLGALILGGRTRGTQYAVAGLLGGSLLRMLPPLAVVLVLRSRWPAVNAAGLFGCMVAAFLYCLLIETVLLVRLVRAPAQAHDSAAGSAAANGGCLALAQNVLHGGLLSDG